MRDSRISTAGLRVLRLLVGNPPQTVAELTDQTRVTRTAVTEQLNELMAAGFVHRSVEKTSRRGRPRHLYSSTQSALELVFSSNLRVMAPAMLRAIIEIGGQEVTTQVLARVGEIIADHYRKDITAVDPAERLREFSELLNREGTLSDLEEHQGELVLRERICPFSEVVDGHREICEMEAKMISAVVGQPLELCDCRQDGCDSCTFQLHQPTVKHNSLPPVDVSLPAD